MGRIVTLDQNMINMIAAGEVIERPANVVKELMENSIDAGAERIIVEIAGGGAKLISITDDGAGMSADDLRLAFESHSTSKINKAGDLEAISTLGFRGEALASIASVARVTAVTRQRQSNQAHRIEIDCGEKSPVEPCSADYGTKIEVRDIFYKLPARRKFLKTANTEFGHISKHFTRIALANQRLDLRLIRDGREVHRLPKGQTLRERIEELFSRDIAENLLETHSNEKGIEVYALLGTPGISRTNSQLQYVFLNGRFIRDKFIAHAVKEAYRGNMDPSRYPVVFLFIKMPYSEYDVNVHPTKIEVRFYNSNMVHSQILGALREKLLASDLDTMAMAPRYQRESIGNEVRDTPQQAGQHGRISKAMEDFFKKYKTPSQRQFSFQNASSTKTGTSGQKFNNRNPSQKQQIESEEKPGFDYRPRDKYLQIDDSYIVAQSDDGFVVIDQHALHERIIYEDLHKRVSQNNLQSQKLLIPETLEINESQKQLLNDNKEIFDKIGINIADFGPRTISIQSFPTLLRRAPASDFVADLLDMLAEKAVSTDSQNLLDEVLHMAACKAAIKVGQRLSDSEIDELLARRAEVDNRSRCPHGRPTTLKFSISELEKQFKRT